MSKYPIIDYPDPKRNRREFIKESVVSVAAAALADTVLAKPDAKAPLDRPIPTRVLGKTGEKVTIVGLGAGRLPVLKDQAKAAAVVQRALVRGITFFDNAHIYGDGFSEMVYGKALEGKRKGIFLTSKTMERTREKAERDLETSLRLMRTDYLDLWQIHDIRTPAELDTIFGAKGALEALVAAKKAGKARFIGFTGHYDPDIHALMLERGGDLFDTILMPTHAADEHYLSFKKRVMDRAVALKLGITAMKVTANAGLLAQGRATTEECIRYTLTQPTHCAIMGCTTVEQVDADVRIAQDFRPLKPAEVADLLKRVQPIQGPKLENWKRRAAAG